MKRCPQCEFIYEDDQSLCDMDGILLVFDSKKLPKPPALTRSSPLRNRSVTAFAALVLTAVLGLVYFVSTNRQRAYQQTPANAGQPSIEPSASAASESSKTPGESPSETPIGTDASVKDPKVSSTEAKSEPKGSAGKPKSNVSPTAVKSEAAKKPEPNSTSNQKAQSSTPTKKTDSKVGSLIKKTGRLLKKPFKF